MYEKELMEYKDNPQIPKLCLVMDIVADHFKDHNDYIKGKVDSSLRNFMHEIRKVYEKNDPSNCTFYHQTMIDMFYKSLLLPAERSEIKKTGSKIYFVDFSGMFNMVIYERCTFFSRYDNLEQRDIKTEIVTDLFNKKIASFFIYKGEGIGAHVFKFKQDCDIFCYFVQTLNDNFLGVSH